MIFFTVMYFTVGQFYSVTASDVIDQHRAAKHSSSHHRSSIYLRHVLLLSKSIHPIVVGDGDLVLATSGFLPDRHAQDTVGINVESDLHPGHNTRSSACGMQGT